MAEAFQAGRAASQSILATSNGGRGSQEAADACSSRRRAIRRRHSAVDEGRGGRVVARHIIEELEEELEGSDSDPAELYQILAELSGSEEELEEGLEPEIEPPI